MNLQDFFKTNNKVALAFSGGVDSSYLLYAAINSGADVTAYFVQTEFQPKTEVAHAIMLATTLRAKMKIVHVSALADERVIANSAERCYYCKNNILKNIFTIAKKDGYNVVIDGTNASDLESNDRPGVKALNEWGVMSPLALAGLRKEDIRELSKAANLFVWDKPSYACLATRVATGEPITAKKLEVTEIAEDYLLDLGLENFRVRTVNGMAILEVTEKDMATVMANRQHIFDELSPYYSKVLLNLNYRK